MPQGESKPEVLLIGGTGTVWKYSFIGESGFLDLRGIEIDATDEEALYSMVIAAAETK
ncbi:MAG: hypothetical protein SGJ27_00600 [Candidatus Melainabacteria bacterium]|nr:hypothetical protein [Candidatus Melainabacteria bacterium]